MRRSTRWQPGRAVSTGAEATANPHGPVGAGTDDRCRPPSTGAPCGLTHRCASAHPLSQGQQWGCDGGGSFPLPPTGCRHGPSWLDTGREATMVRSLPQAWRGPVPGARGPEAGDPVPADPKLRTMTCTCFARHRGTELQDTAVRREAQGPPSPRWARGTENQDVRPP